MPVISLAVKGTAKTNTPYQRRRSWLRGRVDEWPICRASQQWNQGEGTGSEISRSGEANETYRELRDLVVDSIGLPYPHYLGTVVRRTILVWLLIRMTYVVVLMVGVLPFGLISPSEGIAAGVYPAWTIRVFLVMVGAFLVWWDRRRSHELLLHANLGASPGWFWTASLLSALVMDLAIQALLELL